jgi:sugar phosphate isomerase/epimerase
MAAGIMPEATPIQLVEAAASAGFDFGGMWMEAADWTSQTTRDVARCLRETGLQLLDIEVVWIKPGPLDPDHLRIVEVGAELGARNVLCVSSDPDRQATIDKLGQIADHGRRAGIRVNLEFGLFTEVRTLADASAILDDIASPDLCILVDALHLIRSGGTPAELLSLPRDRISYAQLCDAPAPGVDPADPQAILAEAIDGRLPLGQGGLPLVDLIRSLPADIPFAIEERSARLRNGWPDLNARARACYETSARFLEARDHIAA